MNVIKTGLGPSRILVIAPHYWSLINFRGDFLKALIAMGYEVYACAPKMPKDFKQQLKALGATPVTFQLNRTGLNPFNDLLSVRDLYKIIKANDIHVVFPYAIKPIIFGSLAARLAGVPVISMVTGLGFTFSRVSFKAKFLQIFTERLYRFALRHNKKVVFQNADDCDLFLKKNIIPQKEKTVVIDGSGVNLKNFEFRENYKQTQNVKYVFVARLLFEKGIGFYVDAAKALKKDFPEAEFHILGIEADGGTGYSVAQLKSLHQDKIVVFHGRQENVIPYLSSCDIFVLPSYYREGVPRSILEALSIGMPIITTDMPGCKETIDDGKNGFLIEPKKYEPLFKAMKSFLEHPETIGPMGVASRNLAERKFDVNIINNTLVNLIEAAVK
ncbi:MAG: hypothetical protein RLZZ241_2585 [Bacteroidota bacterium]